MEAGRTYFARAGINPHLYVVISDPSQYPDEVVLVNMTTLRPYSDTGCIIEVDEHSFVTKQTCIEYQHAVVTTLYQLGRTINSGAYVEKDPVSEDLLQRIRLGAAESERIQLGVLEILKEQGVLDDPPRKPKGET